MTTIERGRWVYDGRQYVLRNERGEAIAQGWFYDPETGERVIIDRRGLRQ